MAPVTVISAPMNSDSTYEVKGRLHLGLTHTSAPDCL